MQSRGDPEFPLGEISGCVVRDNGRAHTEEDMLIMQGPWEQTEWPLDANGCFRVSNLGSGDYLLWVSELFVYDGVRTTPRKVTIDREQRHHDITLEIGKQVPVTFSANDRQTFLPIDQVHVRARVAGHIVAESSTDVDGLCTLILPSGEYEIACSGHDATFADGESMVLAINSRDDERHVQVLGRHPEEAIRDRRVRVHLLDAVGDPIRGFLDIGSSRFGLQTEPNDVFLLDFEHHLLQELEGTAFSEDRTLAKQVQWSLRSLAPEIEIVLEPLATLTAQLCDEAGLPLVNETCRVSCLSFLSPDSPLSIDNQPDGRVQIGKIPVGVPLTFRVHVDSLSSDDIHVDLEAGESKDLGKVFLADHRLEARKAILSGKVIGIDGGPVSGASIRANLGRYTRDYRTQVDGFFLIEHLSEGTPIGLHLRKTPEEHYFKTVAPNQTSIVIETAPQGHGVFGHQAPALIVQEWINTEPVSLNQYLGRVVLVQFGVRFEYPVGPEYASTDYFPYLAKLHSKYHAHGLEIVFLELPVQPRSTYFIDMPLDALKRKLAGRKWPYHVGIDQHPRFVADLLPNQQYGLGATYSLYQIRGHTACVLIDRLGIVAAIPEQSQLEKRIRSLLREN